MYEATQGREHNLPGPPRKDPASRQGQSVLLVRGGTGHPVSGDEGIG